MVEQTVEEKKEEVQEPKPDSQMVDTEWKACEDGSEEHLLFCSVMPSLESLCEKESFDAFAVLGYQRWADQPEAVPGTVYEAKIRTAEESDGNILHVKVWKPPTNSGEEGRVAALRQGLKETDEFAWTEEHNVAGAGIPGIEAAPQGISISDKVNQTDAATLQAMGFSVNVSEKALFMTQHQGGGVEQALGWIEANRDAPDYEEPLMIMGQSNASKSGGGGGPKEPSAFSQLSKEEKAAFIQEKQRAIREKMKKEEEQNKAENEKAFAQAQKEMAMAKKIADEREEANAIEARKREKAEFLREKKKMLEQLERDKRERFGNLPPEAQAAQLAKQQKSPQELMEHGIKTVKTLYTEIRAPGVAKLCLKTCCTFLRNVAKDQANEKFKKINLDNNAVSTRVGKVNGGIAILKGAGFVENPDGSNTLILEKVDMPTIELGIKLLEPHFD